ncbi:hybrid sensor histidine kinase/response regulator [Pseudoxanthomonas composti]|uniref:histidine kinase n=2 Tax=Pseudoxanthomonas composti TaxID=2137479 RepID=A0A4Q1JZS8_9GAMM|nr:hybrid sensor histidine kinase/response regulator [Pseudoxanthomonas composti]
MGKRGRGWRTWWLALLWLPLVAVAGIPELPRFRQTTIADGLPSTSISALALDREGYLWLGTYDGLHRYDGVSYDSWHYDPTDPDSLGGNAIQALFVDRDDNIWVASEGGGISVLDKRRRGFRHYRPQDHPLLKTDVYAIAQQGEDIWMAAFGAGLIRLSPDGRMTPFNKISTRGGIADDQVYVVRTDQYGVLWVGTHGGLSSYDGRTFRNVPLLDRPRQPAVMSISEVQGSLYVGSDAGVHIRDAGGGWRQPNWAPMFAEGNKPWTIVGDDADGLWIGSQLGLWHQSGAQAPTPVEDGELRFFDKANVLSMVRTSNGGLWAAVFGRGLGYLRADWRRLAIFRSPGDVDGLYCPLLPGREQRLWQVEQDGHLTSRNTQSGRVTATAWRSPRLQQVRPTTALEDHHGKLWLATRAPALLQIDLETGALREWSGRGPDGLGASGAIEGMLEFGQTLWTSSTRSLQVRDLRSGKLLRTLEADAGAGGMLDYRQLSLGADGVPWVASSAGMLRWDADAQALATIQELAGSLIYSFQFLPDGRLWLHRAEGLELWARDQGQWRRQRSLGREDGLPILESQGMVLDSRGRIWLSSLRGLFRIDPNAEQRARVRIFGTRDGLTTQEFIPMCLHRVERDVLAGATMDGRTVLMDMAMQDTPPYAPVLRLAALSFVRNGESIDLGTARSFILRADDRELQADMRLMAFDDPPGNHYRSRLVGFDPDWVNQGSNGSRVLTSLKPGRYSWQLQGMDSQGNASEITTLQFTVEPPWYASHWGLALQIALLALLGWWIAWAYNARLRRKAAWQLAVHKREVAEQASLAKTRFLATLGHEVRTPMTGVLGMSELLLETELNPRQRGYAAAIQSAGKHLLRLVNDALDLARIEAGKLPLDQQDFELRALVEEAAVLVRPMAERKRLAFDCQIAAEVPQVLRGDPARLRQILLNLLLNAVKFTEHGRIGLSVAALQPEGVRFEISDTGPGVSLEQQARIFQRFEQAEGARTAARYGGSGLGLAICHELAVAMGGQIQVHSVLGQGTRFVVSLPLPAISGAVEARPEAPATRAPHALRVLLVEDDPTVADVVRGLLEARGHRVDHAVHGLAALTEVAVNRYEVALLDLDLPGLDGLALARQLRSQGFIAPMLAVTARADADAEALAMEAGFNGFLRKPLTGLMLEQAIAAVMPAGGASA